MARLRRLPWRVPAGLLLAVAGLGFGFLWFKDSQFARVERVVVTGTGSSEHERVRAALEATGRGMSTLALDEEALRDAVSPFASVAGVRIRADFPHDLRIEVVEHEPVATVDTGARTVPATGGGLLLEGVRADDLPTVEVDKPAVDGHVRDAEALQALRVAAAAPAALRARAERLFVGDGGLRLDLAGGPDLIFGDAAAAERKWRAAARVLGEESAVGATYLDLRVAGLVAAGGVGPVAPEPTPDPVAEVLPDPAAALPAEPSTVG